MHAENIYDLGNSTCKGMLQSYNLYNQPLTVLPDKQLLITTLNAHSFNVASKDKDFAEALKGSDVLLPDGISVVWAWRLLTYKPFRVDLKQRKLQKIAGEDLFWYEMARIEAKCIANNGKKGSVFFLGSTEIVLQKIKERARVEFPNIEVHTYSPPYKPEFTDEDNTAIFAAINAVQPDVLFVGMTAPKQEKWAYKLVNSLQLIVANVEMGKEAVGEQAGDEATELLINKPCHICCIGAVFDFYAGTVKRAPQWIIRIHLEWLYRLVNEPKRMWRRYLIGNIKFIWAIFKEWVFNCS